jgi:outer membrane biosynthesis protein TonB
MTDMWIVKLRDDSYELGRGRSISLEEQKEKEKMEKEKKKKKKKKKKKEKKKKEKKEKKKEKMDKKNYNNKNKKNKKKILNNYTVIAQTGSNCSKQSAVAGFYESWFTSSWETNCANLSSWHEDRYHTVSWLLVGLVS